MSHNHPIDETDYSFSNDNIDLFSQFNLIKLRGCDEKYVYQLTRNYLDFDKLPDDWKTRGNYLHCFNVYKAKDKKIGYRRSVKQKSIKTYKKKTNSKTSLNNLEKIE